MRHPRRPGVDVGARRIPVTERNAKAEIEHRMGELVDLLAVFIGTEIDARAWSQLLVYAPKHLRIPTTE